RAAVRGDVVQAATWIAGSDGRLRAERRFQVRRKGDGQTLARARIDYVCINLDSGRAVRMPDSFARAYVPTQSESREAVMDEAGRGAISLHELVLEDGRSATPFVWRIRYAFSHKVLAFESRLVDVTRTPNPSGT